MTRWLTVVLVLIFTAGVGSARPAVSPVAVGAIHYHLVDVSGPVMPAANRGVRWIHVGKRRWRMELYNGNQAGWRWDAPAKSFGPEGFTFKVYTKTVAVKGSRQAAEFYAAGDFYVKVVAGSTTCLSEAGETRQTSGVISVQPGSNATGDLYLRYGPSGGPTSTLHYRGTR
jgi:hypothetical protein